MRNAQGWNKYQRVSQVAFHLHGFLPKSLRELELPDTPNLYVCLPSHGDAYIAVSLAKFPDVAISVSDDGWVWQIEMDGVGVVQSFVAPPEKRAKAVARELAQVLASVYGYAQEKGYVLPDGDDFDLPLSPDELL